MHILNCADIRGRFTLIQQTLGLLVMLLLITFRVRHSQGEVYIGHGRLCVCVCLSLAAFPHCCTDPDVTCGNGRGCRQVVHHWADLQLVHGFRCYDSIRICKLIALYILQMRIAPNAKCQLLLVLVLYGWFCDLTLFVGRPAAFCYIHVFR